MGDVLFVHGGISLAAAVKYRQVAQLNAAFHDLKEVTMDGVLGSDGPLWYRGYARNSDERTCTELRKTLDLLGASYMVMGHTVKERMIFRCNRAVFVDTGISYAMLGRPSALEIVQKGGVSVRMKALYGDSEETLFDLTAAFQSQPTLDLS